MLMLISSETISVGIVMAGDMSRTSVRIFLSLRRSFRDGSVRAWRRLLLQAVRTVGDLVVTQVVAVDIGVDAVVVVAVVDIGVDIVNLGK